MTNHTNVEALQMGSQQLNCCQHISVIEKQNFTIRMTAEKQMQQALVESFVCQL
jgi:hypothetical protein